MFIIDRFEESWAIIECNNKKIFKLPRAILPATIKEGDVVSIIVEINQSETENRKRQVTELLDNFFDE